MNSYIKTTEEIETMRAGGRHLARILRLLSEMVKPGVNLLELETKAVSLINAAGGSASFKGYNGYPASICASVNDEVVHGLPRDYVIENGDVVALDVGLKFDGYHTDSATTVIAGIQAPDAQKLLSVTKGALEAAIDFLRPGIKTGDLGEHIGSYITEHNMGIVKELVGHGVGKKLQEDPMIPNYGKTGEGVLLEEGMTIAIEPMVTLGDGHVILSDDGFTYKSADGSLAAHFEHTVLITKDGAEILTKE